MDSKVIKEEILSHKFNEKKIDIYVKKDFKATIQAIINAIYKLIKEHSKNEEKVSILLNKLEEITISTDNKEKLIIIYKLIDELITRINKHLSKQISVELQKSLITRLRQIISDSKNRGKEQKIIILEKIIFEEQDLSKIYKIFNSSDKLVKYKECQIVFEKLIKEYITLEENSNKAMYYYKVISLMLASKQRNMILSERVKYLKILKNVRKTKTIESIINKLNYDYKVDLEEVKRRYNISFTFPSNLGETLTYNPKFKYHDDLIKYPSITIDDEGNSCHDDAISLYENYDGTYTLRIDIADVPAIVPYNSYVDKIAYQRMENIYTSKKTITIYPPYIAYQLGSLVEEQEKYVLSYFYRIDSNFDIIEDSFCVKSAKTFVTNNLSYEQANILLERGNDDNLSQMLTKLSYIASKNFRSSSPSIINSESMVGDFATLVNRSVSAYFKQTGYPFMYYVQKRLDEDTKKSLLKGYNGINGNNINCENIVNMLISTYEEGMYSIEPKCHEALGIDTYAKVTNPLRLYPSSLCEYIIYDIIINKNIDNATLYKWEAILKEVVPYANERIKLNGLFQKEFEQLLAKNKIRKK